jgi:hypothetical protein
VPVSSLVSVPGVWTVAEWALGRTTVLTATESTPP